MIRLEKGYELRIVDVLIDGDNELVSCSYSSEPLLHVELIETKTNTIVIDFYGIGFIIKKKIDEQKQKIIVPDIPSFK